MEISASTVVTGVAIPVAVWFGNWVGGQIASVKITQKTLFDKKDALEKELNEFKLDVAKNYVNREAMDKALETALGPVVDRLDDLHEDLKAIKNR